MIRERAGRKAEDEKPREDKNARKTRKHSKRCLWLINDGRTSKVIMEANTINPSRRSIKGNIVRRCGLQEERRTIYQ